LMAVDGAMRALAPPPWIIESAQIQQESFGYNVMHPVGDGPDDVTVSLYDFACENPVLGPETVSLENQIYSQTFDNFTYDIDIHPLMIYNSSLVSFDTSNPMTGFSIGHIKFCTLVLSKMSRPGAPDLDVSFLKTKFDLTFNLTNNAFGTDGQLLLPSQNVTFPTGASITGINPSSPAEEAAIINALEQAILSQLVNVTIPPGMTIVAGANNTIFSNGVMNATVNVGIEYNCNTPAICQSQNALAQQYLPALMNALLNALNNGSVVAALNNNNIPGINNATMGPITPPPTTTTQVPTTTQGSVLQQGATVPASLNVTNVTPPANQAETDAMTNTIEQAVENVLQNFTKYLPPGFNLNVDADDPTFANGNMGINVNLTLTYPCSTQAECDNINNNVIPDIIAALLQALQNAIDSGALTNAIQNLAQQNGAPGLSNASVPSGGLSFPGSGPSTTPGNITGLASSSTLQGTLNVGNVPPPTNQADEDAMVDAVENAVSSVLQNIIANLPPGFTLNVDINNPIFSNGGMSNNVDLALTYPCATQAECDNIDSTVAPGIMAAILNALQLAINDGTLAAAIQNAAAQNGAPGLGNPSINPSTGLIVPGVSLPGPSTNVYVNSGSSTTPVSLTAANVTPPANQNETDAIANTIAQAVENVLQNSTILPPGFTLTFNTDNSTFANGNMNIGGNLVITYPCSTDAECINIDTNVIPAILANLLEALQNAISSGELTNEIQALATANNVPNLLNVSTPPGGLQVPTQSVQVPTTTSPGPISGLSDSSTVAANLTIQNVSPPGNQADEDAMIAAVKQGIDDVLQDFASTLPDGFDIFVDLDGASFANGAMLNNLEATVSFPCANQTDCDFIDSNVVPGIIANLLAALQIAINNGSLVTAIQNAAAQNGAPGLSSATVPSTGALTVATTTQQGPSTVPGSFNGSTQSSITPASLAVQNVGTPANQAEEDAMVNAVEQGIATVLQSFTGLPPGYGLEVDITGASFASGAMNNSLDIIITYPCSSQSECDYIDSVIIPGIVADVLAALQIAITNGSLASAIQNAALQNGAPGLSSATIPSPGGLNVPTSPQQVPATVQGPISGLSSSTTLAGNLTVNTVIPPANQTVEDAMTDIVEQAIESVLQGFDSSLPDGFDFFVDLTGVSFPSGDMLNNMDFTISYPCTDQAHCDQIESDIIPGLVASFIAQLNIAISSGELTNEIQAIAAANNVPNFANATVSPSGGGLQVPTQSVQVPTSTPSIIYCADLDTTFTVGNVTPPGNQAEEDAMINVVEQAVALVLQNFTANLPPGFTLAVDVSGAAFTNGNMDNALSFHFAAPCSSSTECSALDPQFDSLMNELIALLNVAINNGSLAAAIQNIAALNNVPGLINSTTSPGSLVPTSTQPTSPNQVNNAITQNPPSGLIQSSVVNADLTILVYAPTSTPAEVSLVETIFQNSVIAVLSNFTATLPAGFGLNIDVTGSTFSGANMTNLLDFTFTYPCADQLACDQVDSTVIPGLVTSLLAALNNAIGSGALAAAINQGLISAGVPLTSPTVTPNPVVVQTPPITHTVVPPIVLSQSLISTNMTVNNVTPPANATVAAAMANVVVGAVDFVLQDFQNGLPPGFNLVVDVTNTSFANGDMLNNLDFAITYACTDDCDYIHNNVIPDFIAALLAALQNAIDNGSLLSALTYIADEEGVPGFSNPTGATLSVPTTTVLVPISNTSPFTGDLPDEFTLDILTQFSVTACQCDDFSLQCFVTPQPVEQNEVFAICLIPSDTSVFVSNFEMTITGSNGFEYEAVSFGPSTYVANGPITTVTYTQIVLIKTYLIGGFFTIGGGSNDVTVTGTAFLENAPGKGLMTRMGKDFAFAIPTADGLPKEEVAGFFSRIVQFFTNIVNFILDLVKSVL